MTTTTSTSSSLPEWALPFAQNLIAQSANDIFTRDAAGVVTGIKPYVPYSGESIAGFTPEQLANQQQFAQLQAPQGFQQGAAGLQQGQNMGYAAGNQGFNQAFSYHAQPQQSLAIPQQHWFPSGANTQQNQPQTQQPPPSQPPFNQGMQSVSRSPQQTPSQQQAFQQGMGVNIVDGQYTFGAPSQTPPTTTQPSPTTTQPPATTTQPPPTTTQHPADPYEASNAAIEAKYGIPKSRMARGETMANYFKAIGYTAPGFAEGGMVPPSRRTPQTPEQQLAFQQGMGVTNVGGQSTFAGTAPPGVSSATPADYGQGRIDSRLASRGFPPQTPPTTTPPSRSTPQTPSQQQAFQQGMGVNIVDGQYTFGAPSQTPATTTQPPPTTTQPPATGGGGAIGTIGGGTGTGTGSGTPLVYGLPYDANAPTTKTPFGQQPDSSAYQSQYQQGVTDVALREAQHQADIQRSAGAMGSIGRGTFGGARQALIQSESDRNSAQNMANIQAAGSQAGFQNAQTQFNADRASNIGVQTQNQNVALDQQKMYQQGQQFEAGLGRDIGLAGLGAGNQASTNLGALSGQEQIANLSRLQAQAGSAAQKQALQQQIDTLNAQNYYTGQQYGIQRAGQLNSLLNGQSVGRIGTTSSPTNLGGQIVGGLATLGGVYGNNSGAINSGLKSAWDWATGDTSAADAATLYGMGM